MLGNLRIGYSGGLVQLPDGHQLRQVQHIDYQPDYALRGLVAEGGLGILRNRPVGQIAVGEGPIREQC